MATIRASQLFSRLTLVLALVLGSAALASARSILAPPSPDTTLEGGPCTMEILVGGVPISTHSARGGTYIEALPDREYSVRLTNRTGGRIAVALSVDGLNSIDARTTSAREASKWVLGPYESITVDGWQTSSGTARRFYFTTEKSSYGTWLGQTKNLGVIAAAVFRERSFAPAYGRHRLTPHSSAPHDGDGRDAAGLERQNEPHQERGDSAAGASAGLTPDRKASAAKERGERKLSDDLAATGIGRELDHEVVSVRFDAEPTPAAVVEVRYEYRDALVRLGVLPRCGYPPCDGALARRERARGFADTGFAPDPFSERR